MTPTFKELELKDTKYFTIIISVAKIDIQRFY